jgi:putative membrane protein
MIRTFLSAALIFTLTGLIGAAQNTNPPNANKQNAANAKADKGQQATITKVDAKNETITVKMKDKDGKEVEKIFKLTGDIRYFDSTGRAVAIDFFRSGDYVLMVEAEGRLKEVRKGDNAQIGQQNGKLPQVDRDFVSTAAEINMAEMRLGKLAQERGTAAAVKELGQRLADDHTKFNAELRKIAESQQMLLPSKLDEKHQDLLDQLSKVNGATFDANFARDMIKGHEHAIQKFEAEIKDGQDPTVKSLAEKWLPALRQHLQMARNIVNQGK